MSEETLEISFDEIEKEREKYLLVDTRDKVTVEYGMIPGAISVPEQELEERGIFTTVFGTKRVFGLAI